MFWLPELQASQSLNHFFFDQTQSSSPTNASKPPLSSLGVSLGWSSHFYQQLQEPWMA